MGGYCVNTSEWDRIGIMIIMSGEQYKYVLGKAESGGLCIELSRIQVLFITTAISMVLITYPKNIITIHLVVRLSRCAFLMSMVTHPTVTYC